MMEVYSKCLSLVWGGFLNFVDLVHILSVWSLSPDTMTVTVTHVTVCRVHPFCFSFILLIEHSLETFECSERKLGLISDKCIMNNSHKHSCMSLLHTCTYSCSGNLSGRTVAGIKSMHVCSLNLYR